jgi:hypothetical protein
MTNGLDLLMTILLGFWAVLKIVLLVVISYYVLIFVGAFLFVSIGMWFLYKLFGGK